MKRNKFSTAVLALALSSAGMLGTAQVAQSTLAPVSQSQTKEIKGTQAAKPARKVSQVAEVGGLEVHEYNGGYGMSPKEYGMRYAKGPSAGKTNRLRCSHNAKVKRRNR